MSLFFGKKKSALSKQAESALQVTDKVIHYRRDVLSASAVDDLIDEREHVAELLAALLGRRYKAKFTRAQQPDVPQVAKAVYREAAAPDIAKLDKAEISRQLEKSLGRLGDLLQKHGGRIYPNTFGAENIEMLVVAAILAIGIRSFFFQPFKIPTNSMWPTYAGMIPVVYQLDEPRPNLVERGINRLLYWSSNYYVTAPTSGEVLIPVVSLTTDLGAEAQLLRESGEGSQLFGLRKVPQSNYLLQVGSERLSVSVPQDFPLEPVVLQTYFPGYDSLQQVLNDYRAQQRVQVNTHISSGLPVYLIRTGVNVQAGEAVLDFDIKTGDMLFVDRFSYNFVPPKIGEPIVFRTDNIPGLRMAVSERGPFLPDERYYIKRLVGQGGDTLAVDGSTLLRNGEPISGAAAFDLNAQQADSYPGYQARWQLANGKSDAVRQGFYYALGDNSPESYDSRGWGYDFGGNYIDKRTPMEKSAGVPENQVPIRDVVGKAMFIFYPIEPRWGVAK